MIGKHAQAILLRVLSLEIAAGTPPPMYTSINHALDIPMSTMFLDAEGADVISLGQLMHRCTALENQVEMMRASIFESMRGRIRHPSVPLGRGSHKLGHEDTSQGNWASRVM